VLASGAGGLAVVRALARVLPHEDVVFLADHAYAPYARRPGRVVVDRVGRLAAGLVGDGAKLIVLASPAATLDALADLRARLPVPVVGFDGLLAHAGALARGGAVGVVVGEGCVRGVPFTRDLRAQRGARTALVAAWPGLREAVEAGHAASPEVRRLVHREVEALAHAGAAAVALCCPHASAVRAAVEAAAGPRLPVLDACDVVARRVRAALVRDGMVARRRRPGRPVVESTDPARGGAGVASGLPERPARRD
jgi:glutamate racemase